MRARALVAGLAMSAACTSSGGASRQALTAGWPTGLGAGTCATRRYLGSSELRSPGVSPEDVVREVSLECDVRGVELWATDLAADRSVIYPSDAASFDAAWRAALPRVNEAECYDRWQAAAGKRLPPTTAIVGLGVNGSNIACAASSGTWNEVRAAITRSLDAARARFPSPLPSCCASKAPCESKVGESCW